MNIRVRHVDLRVQPMQTRIPFRYGIAELRKLPHLIVTVDCEIDGKLVRGQSADGLAPKWFTKNPESSIDDDLKEMILVITTAANFAVEVGEHQSFFSWWIALYQSQKRRFYGAFPSLLYNFGVSVIERAVIDSACRGHQITFSAALRSELFRIDLGELRSEMRGIQPQNLLPNESNDHLTVRHTVGLSDPLRDSHISSTDRVNDGLPQSLEACIRRYGLTHFKIKLCGDADKDLARLIDIYQVLNQTISDKRFAFTLDGNEQFQSANAFRSMWDLCLKETEIKPFLDHLIFVEQPIHRDYALNEQAESELLAWHDRPPMIIDESDSDFDSLPRALACGYIGTSHKNCKGVVKGIVNACHISMLRRERPEDYFELSAEDLSNVGPIALLQDLAVCANLGMSHVERNGHHYFAGLSMWPEEIQSQSLTIHPDLYQIHNNCYPSITIQKGAINFPSILKAPFGIGFELDVRKLMEIYCI